MPTMIVLQARAKRGKTSTFRELAKLINNEVELEMIEPQIQTLTIGSKEFFRDDERDFIIVANYCGKKIAIISGGDKPKTLKARLEKVYKNHGDIDILFGACRTKGSTVDTVKKFAQKNKFELFFTSTYQRMDKNKEKSELLNSIRAKELFGLIQTEDIFKI